MKDRPALAVALAVIAIAAGAQLAVPGLPVPISLQSFALFVGAIALGPRLTLIAVAAYLALGALGVPLFARGTAGWKVLAGPTGGFLWAFLPASFVLAFGYQRASNRLARAGLVALATALLLLLGGIWLAFRLDQEPVDAFQLGVLPLLPGALAKGVLIWLLGERFAGYPATRQP